MGNGVLPRGGVLGAASLLRGWDRAGRVGQGSIQGWRDGSRLESGSHLGRVRRVPQTGNGVCPGFRDPSQARGWVCPGSGPGPQSRCPHGKAAADGTFPLDLNPTLDPGEPKSRELGRSQPRGPLPAAPGVSPLSPLSLTCPWRCHPAPSAPRDVPAAITASLSRSPPGIPDPGLWERLPAIQLRSQRCLRASLLALGLGIGVSVSFGVFDSA